LFKAPRDANPTSIDGIITYGECETNTIYIAVEVEDNDSSLTTSVLQGLDFISARALIVLGTAIMQYAHVTRYRDPNVDALDNIFIALIFIELRKPAKTTPPASLSTVHIQTPSPSSPLKPSSSPSHGLL